MGIRKLRHRLNKKGETLAETLVALLVAGISVALLVSMIVVSTRMLRGSEENLTAYYDADAKMVAKDASSKLSEDTLIIKDDKEHVLTIGGENVKVQFFANKEAKKKPVVSYSYVEE